MTENTLEQTIIKKLQNELGYNYIHGLQLSPETNPEERKDFSEVILRERLKTSIDRLNPGKSEEIKQQAIKKLYELNTIDLIGDNENFHNYLANGIEVEYLENGDMRGTTIKLIDYEDTSKNEFLAVNQLVIEFNGKVKRPDVILYMNGLPLVVFELKNPRDENATIGTAFNQFQTYKKYIPNLFIYNSLLIISDGLDAKYGTLTAPYTRFMNWKTKDGIKEDAITEPQVNTLIKGMLNPETLLELIKDFTVFEKDKKFEPETGLTRVETVKKVAAYHQYYAVKKAVARTHDAASAKGDGRAGVMWHTQGSGKSLSMVFYSGKLVQSLNNPTIVVITDRNDLDNQLFDTFVASKQLLRQEPVQATSRSHLRKLLNVVSGGIVFTTIQKFSPEDEEDSLPVLTDRKNVVIVADEAHRSQYGFAAKTITLKDRKGEEIGAKTKYGFAKYLRDALPNASFIGFTGTPIEEEDKNTPMVFGNYIDIYDISQAVEDGATVKIYYESRLVDVHLKEEYRKELDEEVSNIVENEESTAAQAARAKWTRVEAIVGHEARVRDIAKDIVDHFTQRKEAFQGKAMIVCMSRRIAVEMYEQIVKLKPEWHSEELKDGNIKLVMTSSSSDPLNWQPHHTNKEQRRFLADRFKDPEDPLEIVIVRDMWLTGFDAPCVTTMYVDKPMQGHNLMQAIARVNRIYKEKSGGLIVDYFGIASDLKKALSTYANSGGRGEPTVDIEKAISIMKEKFEIVTGLLWGLDFSKYFGNSIDQKLRTILETQEFILGKKDGKDNFVKFVVELSKAFALVIPHPEAMKIKEDVAFFQAVKARLVKYEPKGEGLSDQEIDTAIRQIVDKAVVSEGVIDIYKELGIESPEISILSEQVLNDIQNQKYKNIAVEMLNKLLADEIRVRSKINAIQAKKLLDMLSNAIAKYKKNILNSTEVINLLVEMARDLRKQDEEFASLGLSVEEIAFYDALSDNDSAREVLGDSVLKKIAQELVDKVKENTTIDWTIRESVKAKMRVLVKRILKKYDYPPDKQRGAIEKLLKQAELFSKSEVGEV